MNKKIVTVITPTFNRAEKLEILYKSLCDQTDKSFIWFIVDDGSVDDTNARIDKWIREGIIDIKYVYKDNGGKHTALNVGIKAITTPLTFIVDSDDYLTSDAIQTILLDYEKIDRADICGIAYLRQRKDGHYLTNKFVPYDGIVENFVDCRYRRNIFGDMAEVWLTKYLKEFPFPEFKNEKFISEDVVWIKMSQKYKIVFYNKAIYMSDYLEGGLTKTRRRMNIKSPKGCMYRGEIQLDAKLPIKYSLRAMLYYSVYGRFAKYSWWDLFRRSRHKFIFLICLFPSMFIYLKWKRKYLA